MEKNKDLAKPDASYINTHAYTHTGAHTAENGEMAKWPNVEMALKVKIVPKSQGKLYAKAQPATSPPRPC